MIASGAPRIHPQRPLVYLRTIDHACQWSVWCRSPSFIFRHCVVSSCCPSRSLAFIFTSFWPFFESAWRLNFRESSLEPRPVGPLGQKSSTRFHPRFLLLLATRRGISHNKK
ncbi:hypothetical protein M378DRAFT_757604 [Amanita muscaria Koide BX008]|uniref:Uncharacterized protein n=1 Tax=Amanita muscaria (strain Koide BX008) TaxID=946122 RepID=A0A0C2SHH0_AMAMK|nr:hypothetical protein M378DRAFT_757604 [Amanita muscaria Koide BX008]